MDEIEREIALSVASGTSSAVICLFSTLTVTLVAKGVLAKEDMATLPGIAMQMLEAMDDLSADSRQKADSVLRELSTGWLGVVTRN